MRSALLLLLTFVTNMVFSQTFEETIDSKKLGGSRNFSVTLPPYYEQNVDKKYPTLLILDGEYLSAPFNGILKYGNYWDDLPEMIVISVYQNYGEQRFKDSEFDEAGLPSGSGAAFFEFLGMELLPYVEGKYRTQPFRVIAGHDTTAGFLNFYLYKDNPVFNGYISLAPEMAPEMEKRVAERLATIQKPVMYYQASGQGDLPELRDKTAALDQNIKAIGNKNFRYQYDDFPGASHYSLVAQAIPHALYFIFDGYQPISMVEFQDKIVKLDSGYTQYLIDKYENLEKNMGLKVTPRLTDFKAIEAAIVKNKAYPELQDLSKYAEKQYPKTTLSVYHQALYYEKMGEYKKAIKTYNSAFTREAIRELSKDYMLNRAERLKNKKDESITEEYSDPEVQYDENGNVIEPTSEEGEKKEDEE
ncbi:alpha/beta hydrolase-fold protein [Flavobacterium okayamense]|uniref:Histidine kinase n=1 Tax=Flavobacterium okayamense TaxID=2830782 RepID=A0ABN6HYI3_9FLAO|nr:alpha/beta hydrolase-fold protein [Flavobacterium okayamense]BCY27977.1 histidine kinase [Flavobacterium okayamense]